MDITLERILSLIPSEKDGRFKKYAAADFASKIGVAQNLPSEWKAGRNKSYKTKLQTIADAYNVSIDWLCCTKQNKGGYAPLTRRGAEIPGRAKSDSTAVKLAQEGK